MPRATTKKIVKFHITGPFGGETAGHWWIALTQGQQCRPFVTSTRFLLSVYVKINEICVKLPPNTWLTTELQHCYTASVLVNYTQAGLYQHTLQPAVDIFIPRTTKESTSLAARRRAQLWSPTFSSITITYVWSHIGLVLVHLRQAQIRPMNEALRCPWV